MFIDENKIRDEYREITETLIRRSVTVTAMESCTSGTVASLLTDTEGSSAVMKGSLVTYSNEAKCRFGVPSEVIAEYGVYSPETAVEMARACRRLFSADFGIGVTGSFGNADPANADSVPGAADYAIDSAEGTEVFHLVLPDLPDRRACKLYTAGRIAEAFLKILKQQ